MRYINKYSEKEMSHREVVAEYNEFVHNSIHSKETLEVFGDLEQFIAENYEEC